MYLIGDESTIEDTIRGVLTFIMFLRSIGDVKPVILTTFGIDSPQIDPPQMKIDDQIKSIQSNKLNSPNTYVSIVNLHDGDDQCWEKWILIFDLFNDTATSVDVNDLNFQIKPDFPLTVNDRDYVKMKLRNNSGEEDKRQMFKSQYSSQLNEILTIVDSNKRKVPKSNPVFKIQSTFTNDVTQAIRNLEVKFERERTASNPSSKSNSNLNLKLSDESLQFVSRSNTESEMLNRGDELWNKGYTFFKKMLE